MYMNKHLYFFTFLTILMFSVSNGQQKKYIEYKLKQGESLKTLAKKLGVKTKVLKNLNPDISKKPPVNTVVILPNNRVFKSNITKLVVKEEKIEEVKEAVQLDFINKDEILDLKTDIDRILNDGDTRYIVHSVQKGDTFYSLTRYYKVTQVGLIALNPALSEGLKTGQVIKIKELEEKLVLSDTIYKDQIKKGIALKVAMLLPFRANESDTLMAKTIFSKSKLAGIVTDFYLGAEIAVDSLRKQGVAIDVNVFDTEKAIATTKNILANNNLNKSDVVIGPVFSDKAALVASEIKTPIVFPFYSKSQFKFSSKNLLKIAPEKTAYRQKLINFIKLNFNKGNLILVGDGKTASNIASNEIKKSLLSHDSVSNVHVLKPKDGYIAKERFLEILKPKQKNWVVIVSNNRVVVADAINSLISLPEDTTVKVFTYDKGKAFDMIANLKLASINLTYVTDYYARESSSKTKLFNRQFYRKNNALPSLYATKGFDVTYDILMRLASGDSLSDTFKKGVSYRVENKFNYSKSTSGIIENKGLFILKYNKNLSIKRIR